MRSFFSASGLCGLSLETSLSGVPDPLEGGVCDLAGGGDADLLVGEADLLGGVLGPLGDLGGGGGARRSTLGGGLWYRPGLRRLLL